MAVPKRIRGKRARIRQREQRGLDLRPHYRQDDLPPAPDLAVVEFDDPLAPSGWVNPDGTLDPKARLQQARRSDGNVAAGEPEWVAPPHAQVRAVARLKQDPLGRMFHRRQLDQPQFQGGRQYQELYDHTQVALVRSVDLSKTRVSGIQRYDPLTDSRQRASRKLRFADDALMHRHGSEGLSLVRTVLCERVSVEQAGRLRGAGNARDIRWYGSLFRRCLSVLSVQFGFASSIRQPPRPMRFNGHDGGPDLQDPAMHASRIEISDPGLRRGRPNGQGK